MPLKKATQIGQLLNSWTAILILVGSIIIGTVGIIYSIESNTTDISNLRITIKDNNESITREFEIQSSRADKRYYRINDELNHCDSKLDKLRDCQINVLQRLSYIEGKLNNYEN